MESRKQKKHLLAQLMAVLSALFLVYHYATNYEEYHLSKSNQAEQAEDGRDLMAAARSTYVARRPPFLQPTEQYGAVQSGDLSAHRTPELHDGFDLHEASWQRRGQDIIQRNIEAIEEWLREYPKAEVIDILSYPAIDPQRMRITIKDRDEDEEDAIMDEEKYASLAYQAPLQKWLRESGWEGYPSADLNGRKWFRGKALTKRQAEHEVKVKQMLKKREEQLREKEDELKRQREEYLKQK